MMCRVRRALSWALRSAFYDAGGTLSLGRCAIAFGLLNAWCVIWLGVAWVAYVTLADRMETAAPLAGGIAQILSAIFSAQLLVTAFQYWTQKRYGAAGSVTPEQLDNEQGPGGV